MLDISDVGQVIDESWDVLSSPVELPEEWTDFFDHHGPTSGDFDESRGYHRFHLRGKAILKRNGAHYGIFTKDISRTGMGFYCGEQLFPCENVSLWLPNGTNPEMAIVRCLRIKENCYECGAIFVR